jgi:hypothetical protein
MLRFIAGVPDRVGARAAPAMEFIPDSLFRAENLGPMAGAEAKCGTLKMCKSQNTGKSAVFRRFPMLIPGELHNWLLFRNLSGGTKAGPASPPGLCGKQF